MDAWAFAFWFYSSNNLRSIRSIDMQGEKACISAAISITARLPVDGMCINAFDGKVLWFSKGKQVERI